MKLLKPWAWRPDAALYNNMNDVVYSPYPFYWYWVQGNNIDLVKQLSKFRGVIQDSNSWVSDKLVEEDPVYSTEDMYQDRRSWQTLGPVPYDPIDQISTFIWGNKKVQLSYTPDGQLFERKEWINDQISYTSNFEYNKSKGRYFASYYKNSEGVKVTKYDKLWTWISGKPLITKKYGKH